MFDQMGYKDHLAILLKFRKPNLAPIWNGLFTLIFNSFSKRTTGSDSASKLFLTILYGLYSGVNLDYGSILWTQLVQSNLTMTRHVEISSARFWAIVVQRAFNLHHVHVTEGSTIAHIQMFHTSNVTVSNSSWFVFIDSIPDEMLLHVPPSSEIIVAYHTLLASGPRPLTPEMQKIS